MIPIIRIRNTSAVAWGRNARNNAFEVEIAGEVLAGQSWLGVLAQEVFESRHKWSRGLIGVALVRRWREDMELMGHTIEACVASQWDGFDYDAYLLLEAQTLVSPWSSYQARGLFKGKTEGDVLALMQQRERQAARWVREHAGFLNRWAARREAEHGRV